MIRFAGLVLAAVLAGGCGDEKKATSPSVPNADQFDKSKSPPGSNGAPPKGGSKAG